LGCIFQLNDIWFWCRYVLRWRVTNARQWLTEPNPAVCCGNRSICTAARAVVYGTGARCLVRIRIGYAQTGLGGSGMFPQEFHVQTTGRKELVKRVKTVDGTKSIRRAVAGARLVHLSPERPPCGMTSAGEAFVQNVLNHLRAFDDGNTARRGMVPHVYRVAAF